MITFITSDDGTLESYAALTRESKREYCERHGYDFHSFDLSSSFSNMDGVNVYWRQVRIMLAVMGEIPFGWMNYTGADSFILPDAGPCEHLLDENYDLIVSKDKNGLNNNGFFLRNSDWSRTFLEKVWALRSDQLITVYDNGDGLVSPRPYGLGHSWFEQAAFIAVLREMGLERVKLVDQKLINAYPKELYPDCEDGNFIVHLPGLSNDVRTEYVHKILAHEYA